MNNEKKNQKQFNFEEFDNEIKSLKDTLNKKTKYISPQYLEEELNPLLDNLLSTGNRVKNINESIEDVKELIINPVTESISEVRKDNKTSHYQGIILGLIIGLAIEIGYDYFSSSPSSSIENKRTQSGSIPVDKSIKYSDVDELIAVYAPQSNIAKVQNKILKLTEEMVDNVYKDTNNRLKISKNFQSKLFSFRQEFMNSSKTINKNIEYVTLHGFLLSEVVAKDYKQIVLISKKLESMNYHEIDIKFFKFFAEYQLDTINMNKYLQELKKLNRDYKKSVKQKILNPYIYQYENIEKFLSNEIKKLEKEIEKNLIKNTKIWISDSERRRSRKVKMNLEKLGFKTVAIREKKWKKKYRDTTIYYRDKNFKKSKIYQILKSSKIDGKNRKVIFQYYKSTKGNTIKSKIKEYSLDMFIILRYY